MTRLGARSIDDFCNDIGLGRSALYKRARLGEITIRKIGRRSVILDEDADAFLRSLPVAGPKQRRAKRA